MTTAEDQVAAAGRQLTDLFAADPEFARAAEDFMHLTDAADVLDDRKPPHGDTASAFLREVAKAVITQAGMPEGFADLMMASKPPRLRRGGIGQ
jgi:hypothetical protein